MKRMLFVTGWLLALSSAAPAADTAPAPTLADLMARIERLEAQAQQSREQADAALAAAQAARAELERIKAAQAAPAVAAAPVAAPAAVASSGGSGNAFNPAISVILNGEYAHHSVNPDNYTRPGFPIVGEGGPGARGLSLGESEVSLASNIDEKFYGQLTLSVASDDGADKLSVEEAYIDTTALPEGFNLRAGRFFSNIGYLNSHHAHTDKFSDRPLAYQAFLSNQYGDDGVQLRWLAPTDTYLEIGSEAMRGENFPSGGAARSGVGVKTFFVHAGGDVGVENSWLAGLSALRADTALAEDGFHGRNTLYIADATWRWAPGGNAKDGGVTLRGEYLLDDRDGRYIDLADPSLDQPWQGQRRGAYVEGVYRINRQWETGYRYDRLWADDRGPVAATHDPVRNSLMLTWLNSEFSLVRLQLSRDESNPEQADNVVTLQYQTSLGAHGAHKF